MCVCDDVHDDVHDDAADNNSNNFIHLNSKLVILTYNVRIYIWIGTGCLEQP